MQLNLTITPANSLGEPIELEIITCWYVMEGDHVHCSCSSPELAKLMIKEMNNAYADEQSLATYIKHIETFTTAKGIIKTGSKLAKSASMQNEVTTLVAAYIKNQKSKNQKSKPH
ncbi:hypothetical protein V2I68_20275 [Pseudomonas viridiflava]|uniref:Uncharacterized protein n=1 Tax=Pseudomonas viridiflava TaxID=33069 RepID=A0ABU7NFU1_PSEVI|nr:hypothetical protein [Pseudomonas viridiflava]MBI6576842.1 hypothetical protein [Pseudomonas viridiflava]MBI6606427.1 hypothetical protein [Pseudomonas viridiflava]MBI6637491.1 hypothetical protein [Pseudomonas viridiflava]MBI6871033.1 hypothetical protein [Pseudomonas viridiflava]MEE3937893.1 hypothetical protein [Pseudomonas viridiflava]